MLASARGNLRQMLAVPEEKRSEAEHKAIIKISGFLNHARHEQMEKSRRIGERIRILEANPLVFENQSYVLMVLRAMAYVATESGYLPGMALRDMSVDNPFLSSIALDQLENLEYIRRMPEGGVLIDVKGRRLIHRNRRRSPSPGPGE